MKKIVLAAASVLVASSVFTSCGKKAEVKSDVDSLAYAVGVSVGSMFNENMAQIPGGKSKTDSIIEGFKAGLKTEQSYVFGMMYARQVMDQLRQQTDSAEINEAVLIEAFTKALKGDTMLIIDNQKAMEIQQNFKSAKKKTAETEAKSSSDKFMADNKAKAGVQATASGLQYKIEVEGKGAIATEADQVKLNYRGTLVDGTEFDKGDGVTFGVTGVIPGFTEALKMMPVGSKWTVYIPWNLAYGERGAGANIKPYSALIFEIEVLEIVKSK